MVALFQGQIQVVSMKWFLFLCAFCIRKKTNVLLFTTSLFECFCISPEVEVAKHLLFGCGSSRRADGSFHSEQSFSVQHQPAKDFPYICTQAMIL